MYCGLTMADNWQNRVIGSDEVSPDDLLANPFNWRIHPKYQQESVEALIEDLGWLKSVIVNKQTGHIVDGHLRAMLALRNEVDTVPVEYVDLTEEEELLVLRSFDLIPYFALKNDQKLMKILDEVGDVDERLNHLVENLSQRMNATSAELHNVERVEGTQATAYSVVRVGEFKAKIEPDTFMKWYTEMEQAIGDEGSVEDEIKRRLGVGDEQDKVE